MPTRSSHQGRRHRYQDGSLGSSVRARDGESKVSEEKIKKEELGSRFPVIFYFHGGRFSSFSRHFLLHRIFWRHLARRHEVIIIYVDCRSSPQYRYPIPCKDCFGDITWLCSDSGRAQLPGNADLSRCFLMSDSAGVNIVHQVGCRVSAQKDMAMKGVRIVDIVLLHPFFGGEERTPSELRLQRAPIVNINNSDWHWKALHLCLWCQQGPSRLQCIWVE